MTRTIEVDEGTAAALEELAADRGVSVRALVADLAGMLYPGPDWSEDIARIEEYERTGVAEDAAVVMAEFQRRVAEAAAKRKW
ncbi:MAG TPA: hypothetical protein VGL66_04985 [Caulobacteraceae bacterium]